MGDQRLPSLVTMCGWLQDILAGRVADDLLDGGELPAEAGLWTPPMWAWVFSRLRMGYKERLSNGARGKMPIRMSWSNGPVLLLTPSGKRVQEWSAVGLGHSYTGRVVVELTEGELLEEYDEAGIPTQVCVPVLSRTQLRRRLRKLSHAGKAAKWELLLYLEPYIEKALHRAHTSVSMELEQHFGQRLTLLDPVKISAIRDHMMLGDDEHPGKVAQLLDRCLGVETFVRVEPIRYISQALRRDANSEVRRALGDPHIGPKIRRVARELGGDANIDQIVAQYRKEYPSDRLSTQRAKAALTVKPDAMAAWAPYRQGGN